MKTAREVCETIVAMIETRKASHHRTLAHFNKKVEQLVVSGDSAGAKAWTEDGQRLSAYIREDEKILSAIEEIVRAGIDPADLVVV